MPKRTSNSTPILTGRQNDTMQTNKMMKKKDRRAEKFLFEKNKMRTFEILPDCYPELQELPTC